MDYSQSNTLTPTAHTSLRAAWIRWFDAFINVLPIYVAQHMACFVITCLAVLFVIKDFSVPAKPLSVLWLSWQRWDTEHYVLIAQKGYDSPLQTAFFPLYSIFIKGMMVFISNAFIAGLVVSSLASLVTLVVLYRLVEEDIDKEHAERTVLYLSVFPTAFFLLAVYNESLFLCTSLLCFYSLRHSRWGLAGLFGLLASLTRSTGLLLILPFCYEYLYQHQFKVSKIRFDVLSMLLIPLGVALFGLYCYFRFHDFFAFSHVQSHWLRHLDWPWAGIAVSFKVIRTSTGLFSFKSLRNLTDLLPDLLVLALILLSFVGPWRLPRKLWAYGIYASGLSLFVLLFPIEGFYPLQSTSRFMLELFPAFVILARAGKNQSIGLSYLMIASAAFFFLLTQFLTGHWVL